MAVVLAAVASGVVDPIRLGEVLVRDVGQGSAREHAPPIWDEAVEADGPRQPTQDEHRAPARLMPGRGAAGGAQVSGPLGEGVGEEGRHQDGRDDGQEREVGDVVIEDHPLPLTLYADRLTEDQHPKHQHRGGDELDGTDESQQLEPRGRTFRRPNGGAGIYWRDAVL